MAKILLLDDDTELATVMQEALSLEGHVVDHTDAGTDALYRLKYHHYDLAVVDWNLPDISGVEVCKQYREFGGKVPIIFLTGRSSIDNKVEAFETGADDYLTKPFPYKELLARIRALLRRPPDITTTKLVLGELELDQKHLQAFKNGAPLDLAPSELKLLELFMSNPDRVFSSEQLLDRVFTTESVATDEAVRQRIMRLRKKIDNDGEESLIKTVKGLGYKMSKVL